MPAAIDRQTCLNHNYTRMNCRRCAAVCPRGCIDGETLAIDAARCDDCGLCLAACPAAAVAGDGFSRLPLEKTFADPAAPVALACRRQQKSSPWPCLGFVDGRLLLALVFSGENSARPVCLDDTACAACRPAVAAHLEETVVETNRLLLLAGKPPLLRGEDAGRLSSGRPISRRAFFSALLGGAIDTVREVMDSGEAAPVPLPRQDWFVRHVAPAAFAGDTPSPFFAALAIGDACLACGLCLRICPRKAITADDCGDALEFTHHPSRCTGCGLCAVHCPQGAITVDPPGRPAPRHVARRSLPVCQSCRQVYQPVGNQPLCIECLLKGKDKSIITRKANINTGNEIV